MSTEPIYETIGVGYAQARRPDPRVGAQISAALGDAASVLNVGAGTGNYEPTDRTVVGLEPAREMLRQRTNANPVVQGFAEALPFPDACFDAALGMFTVHHWTDRNQGLRELRRVTARQVLLVYDTALTSQFWLASYFPAMVVAPWEVNAPTPSDLAEVLDVKEVRVIEIPADCVDGFTGCYWNRPERYLDPVVQAGMSSMARLTDDERAEGSRHLADDLDSGAWDRTHGHLRSEATFDIGYRLVLSG